MRSLVPALLVLAFTVYCVVDVVRSESEDVRGLPKPLWVLLCLLFPLAGGVAWLVAGRPRATALPGSDRLRRPRPSVLGPDDDPDFLRTIDRPAPVPPAGPLDGPPPGPGPSAAGRSPRRPTGDRTARATRQTGPGRDRRDRRDRRDGPDGRDAERGRPRRHRRAGPGRPPAVTTPAQWVAGARPRTLPAAVAPVAAGTGAAVGLGGGDVVSALLALLVSLALQVAVNYANDYSDGVRGTDSDRVGPLRLVGSGVAAPRAVLVATGLSFLVAAAAGVALVVRSGRWELLVVGVLAVVAAWTYTGGRRPYGYAGLGEVAVFVFFGLVAVLGTTWTQADRLGPGAWAGAVGVGATACALLVVNNLRDIPTDTLAGKRTLAVRLGDRRTRRLFVALLAVPVLCVAVAVVATPWALLALPAAALGLRPARVVLGGATGRGLVPALGATGAYGLAFGLLLGLGLALGR